MTCEVALLNRRAVALAADSATTVTYWEQGERKERFFKGTNKLFNLSDFHPVALMTSDSGNMQGVPWEVLVKAYRDTVKAKSHDYVPGYARDFFEFIESNPHLYPLDFQERQLLNDVVDAASVIVAGISTSNAVKTAIAAKDLAATKSAAETRFDEIAKDIEGADFIGNSPKKTVDEIIEKYRDQIIQQLKKRKFISDRKDLVEFPKLAQLSAMALLKVGCTTLSSTGIVVAGYGEKEYFPHLKTYTGRFSGCSR